GLRGGREGGAVGRGRGPARDAPPAERPPLQRRERDGMGLARATGWRQKVVPVLFLAVVSLGAFLFGFRGTGEAAAVVPERDSVVVGLPLTTSTFLPVYLAEEQGLFAEEGLQVEVVPFHGGTALAQALIGG